MTIETLDVDYKDTESLNNLDINTMRCGKHVKLNCALQNVFKIYNWWSPWFDNVKKNCVNLKKIKCEILF